MRRAPAWMASKIGCAQVRLRRHTGGHFSQFLEIGYPENFIDVQVAVVTLRGVGVGPEEYQLCSVVADDNRVA